MKKFKKVCAVILGIIMLVGITATAAVSNIGSQDGIQAVIQTDKNSYDANEDIKVNITVTNTNNHTVKNVSIEGLLPDNLTLKEGSLKSDTVNLNSGETLAIDCVAVLEKEIVTEPDSTESDTTEPTTDETSETESEPDITEEPTETDTEATEPEETETVTEEPSAVEPTETEPTMVEPSTVPDTTDGGIILPIEPTTDRNSPSTTVQDDSDENTPQNPSTGDTFVFIKVLSCLAIAGAAIVGIVVIQKKNGKKATKIISLVLCGAIAFSGIAATGFLSVTALESDSRSFTVQTVITVDGGDYTLEGKVNYRIPEDIELTINQKDFETETSSISLSGTVNANMPINSVQYEVCSEIDDNEASYLGMAALDEDLWYIDDLKVKPGNNKVVITAIADGGNVSESINIKYDIGRPYEVNNANVKYDESKDINYVDNIVLIYFKNNVSTNRIKQIIQENNGTIAGRADFFYQMQVKERSYSEIEKICEKLMQYGEVLYASPDLARHLTESAIPKDPWERKSDWDESNPSGGNWGLEAIEAISAWDYDEYFSHIDVGVVDSGFDLDHEDLKEVLRPSTDWMREENDYRKIDEQGIRKNNSHGTFVAGIVGATDNNYKGTTGALWNTNIYYTDWSPYTKEQSWDTTARLVSSLIYSVEAGAKIVNYSVGNKENITYERFMQDFQGELKSINLDEEVLNYEAGIYSLLMESLLNRGFDFLVVQAAGNGFKVEIEPDKVVDVAVDSKNTSMFCAINEANILASTDKMKQNILDRIIVVGAAKRNVDGSYQQYVYSNGGDRVDLCAPGEDIYGLTVDDKYEKGWVGTSLAAPYVTGVCGMVWSVNPNLSGANIKDIVCNSTSIMVNDNPDVNHPLENTYPMVNAKLAVEEALTSLTGVYGVTGAVMAEDTKEPIANATVSVYSGNTLLGQTQTNDNGTYQLFFYSDKTSPYFKLTVDKAGRWPYINNQLELKNGVTTVVENIYMKLWDSGLEPGDPTPENPFAGGDGSIENPYQISTPEQLDAVRDYLDSNFVLINSIDMAKFVDENGEPKNFIPLGYDKKEVESFTGTFDGKNHSIVNLKIHDKNDYVGLFKRLNYGAVVKNLNITNAVIEAGVTSGTIVGENIGVVKNCTVSGKMSNIEYGMFNGLGGIVGYNYDSATVEDCEFRGYINTMNGNIGGIASGNSGDIIRCCYRGNYCYGGYSTGGIVGFNDGRIIDCYNSSFVSSNYNNGNMGYDEWNLRGVAGGIAGQNSGLIRGCYNNGYVYGWCYDSYYTGRLGGITAENSGRIEYCYNAGELYQTRGIAYIGGITALDQGGAIDHCYNIGSVWNVDCLNYGGVRGNKNNNHVFVADFVGTDDRKDDACEFVSGDTMKTTGFIARLNAEQVYFVQDTKNINGGYPILKWQQE